MKKKANSLKELRLVCVLLILTFGCNQNSSHQFTSPYLPFDTPRGNIQLIFSATADVQYYCGDNVNWFRHACERISIGGQGNFMISMGDMIPCNEVYRTIQTYISQDYIWYPVVGNHELEIESGKIESTNMIWLRNHNLNGHSLPNIVNTGPPGGIETTYSFEYGDVHFVVLNEYYDGNSDTGAKGDITDSLYNWLIDDLNMNEKPIVLVFGHEPAYPQPDEETGRMRHLHESLDKYPDHRDRFWDTLVNYRVKAYVCGHTHNHSCVNINGVWQIDVGHARGTGDQGSRSTFIMFYIMDSGIIWYYTYRLHLEENRYEITSTGQID
jgi:hypothetical protein